jgi:hypothetical protein
MADTFKTFYVVVKKYKNASHFGEWGKGTSLKTALAFADVSRVSDRFIIYQAIIKDTATDEQVKNLSKCFNVDSFGSVTLYSNPLQEDLDMINEYLLGWITNEDFIY